MRYDRSAKFIKTIQGEYDPETGNYAEDAILVRYIPVSVTSLNANTTQMLFGNLSVRAVNVKTLRKITFDFDQIEIEGVRYRPEARKQGRTGEIFICTELFDG